MQQAWDEQAPDGPPPGAAPPLHGPTIASFTSEFLGYAEVNIQNPVRWHTGLPYLLLAGAAAAVNGSFWWWRIQYLAWPWQTLLVKVPVAAVASWCYLKWVSPLEYESVAIKRHTGLEVCTHWKLFEESCVIPLTDLTSVAFHLVADQELRLVVKERGERCHTCFGCMRPDFLSLMEAYATLAVLLPRNVRKGTAAASVPDALAGWALGRWWQRQRKFGCATGAALAVQAARLRYAVLCCCLRAKYRLLQSERWRGAAAALAPWAARAQRAGRALAAAAAWGCAAAARAQRRAAPVVGPLAAAAWREWRRATVHVACWAASAPTRRPQMRRGSSGGGGSGGGSHRPAPPHQTSSQDGAGHKPQKKGKGKGRRR